MQTLVLLPVDHAGLELRLRRPLAEPARPGRVAGALLVPGLVLLALQVQAGTLASEPAAGSRAALWVPVRDPVSA